uniref:Uncharacterized protein n=1 Tax=Romanomermis culicivorax TaxID=13658 RepID=A0A915JAX2_ROMCU
MSDEDSSDSSRQRYFDNPFKDYSPDIQAKELLDVNGSKVSYFQSYSIHQKLKKTFLGTLCTSEATKIF